MSKRDEFLPGTFTDDQCAAPPSGAVTNADDFAYWFEVVRDWSGSAFLAGEKVEDEGALKSALYGDLCRLGNYLMCWADDAKAGAVRPQSGGGQ